MSGKSWEEARPLELEREISDLVNAAYDLTPDEVDPLWRTAPPRMPAVEGAPPAVAEATKAA